MPIECLRTRLKPYSKGGMGVSLTVIKKLLKIQLSTRASPLRTSTSTALFASTVYQLVCQLCTFWWLWSEEGPAVLIAIVRVRIVFPPMWVTLDKSFCWITKYKYSFMLYFLLWYCFLGFLSFFDDWQFCKSIHDVNKITAQPLRYIGHGVNSFHYWGIFPKLLPAGVYIEKCFA